jgi:hypothetical protein
MSPLIKKILPILPGDRFQVALTRNTTPTCGFLIANYGKEKEISIWDY